MFTARFVLLGLVLFITRVSSESHLAKCCPPGEIFSGHSKVECVSVPSGTMELYVLYQNATMPFQGLPQCDEPEDIMTTPLDHLDSNKFLEVPACLEILHEQTTGKSVIIVVHCQSNKDRQVKAINTTFPQLVHVRKCCPHGTIFNMLTKACVSWLNESENLVSFLPNSSADVDFVVVDTQSPPTCEGPIVNYKIHEDDIFSRNGSYSVMVPAFKNDIVAKGEFYVIGDNACLEMTPDSLSDRTLVARVCRDPGYCDRNACIRKCCAEDEFFYAQGCNKLIAPKEPKEFHQAFANALNQTRSSTFNVTKDYGLLIGKPCKHNMFDVDPREEEWSLTSEGYVFTDYKVNKHYNYCMDIFYNKSEFDHNFHLFICFENPLTKEDISLRFRLNIALEITSCAFLLMTLLVYACLPSLQNLHGKTLMCHVSSLLLAFACLAINPSIIPVNTSEDDMQVSAITCKALAYTMLCCFLSSFSWLNVMCFDIWWTFGALRGSTITKARGHRKRFLLYCLYAWGFSFLVSTLTIIVDHTDILPHYLRPDIGNTSCWFSQHRVAYGELMFFIGPVSIQLISNVIFFILTAVHCNKVKAEIKRVTTDPADPRSKRFHSDRNRFVMNIKLFIVMGISWICEVLSFFLLKYFNNVYLHQVFFYSSDVFNCLQGLLIFILFVLKSRVYLALRRRLGLDVKQKPTPTCNATTTVQNPYKVKKSVSSSTLMTTFAINSAP